MPFALYVVIVLVVGLFAVWSSHGTANVVHDSSNILTPVKLDRGTNVAVYAAGDQLVKAGFMWDEARRQLPRKAYLVEQPHGRGRVVAFAEDPATRGFTVASMMLLANAVFFGPAF